MSSLLLLIEVRAAVGAAAVAVRFAVSLSRPAGADLLFAIAGGGGGICGNVHNVRETQYSK